VDNILLVDVSQTVDHSSQYRRCFLLTEKWLLQFNLLFKVLSINFLVGPFSQSFTTTANAAAPPTATLLFQASLLLLQGLSL
jgi:hypothetical protein